MLEAFSDFRTSTPGYNIPGGIIFFINTMQKRKKQIFPLTLILSAGNVASWVAGATRI